jgi:hypothetical protein
VRRCLWLGTEIAENALRFAGQAGKDSGGTAVPVSASARRGNFDAPTITPININSRHIFISRYRLNQALALDREAVKMKPSSG